MVQLQKCARGFGNFDFHVQLKVGFAELWNCGILLSEGQVIDALLWGEILSGWLGRKFNAIDHFHQTVCNIVVKSKL